MLSLSLRESPPCIDIIIHGEARVTPSLNKSGQLQPILYLKFTSLSAIVSLALISTLAFHQNKCHWKFEGMMPSKFHACLNFKWLLYCWLHDGEQ